MKQQNAATVSSIKGAGRVMLTEIDRQSAVRLALALVCVITSAGLAAFAPYLFKLLIDFFSQDAVQAASLPFLLVSGYVASQWIGRMIGELRWLLVGTAEQRFFRRLSGKLFSHVMRLPLRFHLEHKTGAIGQSLEQGLNGYRMLLQQTVFTALPGVIELVVIAVIVAVIFDPIFLFVLGASAVAYAVVFAKGAASILSVSREVSAARVDAHALLTDSMMNFETVKLSAAEMQIGRRYDKALARSEASWRDFFIKRTQNGFSVALVFAAGLGASLLLAVRGLTEGSLTVGDLVLLNTYLLQIIRPIEMLGFAVRDIGQGVAFIEKMLGLMNEKPEMEQKSEADTPARPRTRPAPAKIDFEGVSFNYIEDRAILRDVSFTIEAGKRTALVGPSGAGKSSIIRLLARFYEPQQGRILFDGADISQMDPDDLRRMIAVVPQDTILFNDTLGRNIAFGAEDLPQAEIERAVALARLDGLIAALPDGYETIVGERGLKLSGGEKQRVAIARAALKNPRIFIFDEATSSLDTRTEQEILDNLREVSQGVTSLMIAHRLSTVVNADDIIVLERGAVVERGRHDALLAQNGLYAQMWKNQSGPKKIPAAAQENS